MARRGQRRGEVLAGNRPHSRRRALQPAEPVERLDRRQAASLAPATPWLIATMRRSIWTKSPESARFDHSALAVVCTSTSQPWPRFSAVTSGVPSASRAQVLPARSSVGLGQHLARHGDVGGDRRARRTGCPARTARAAPASPTTARRRSCARRGAVGPAADGRSCLGEMRPGKAQHHAAGFDPFRRSPLRRPANPGRRRVDQHGDVAASADRRRGRGGLR